MRVIKGLNSRYTFIDLIIGKEKDYHVSDMKPFLFDSAIVDPLDIARRDRMEFFIEKFQITGENWVIESHSNFR